MIRAMTADAPKPQPAAAEVTPQTETGQPYPVIYAVRPPTPPLAVWALVLGIVGAVLFWVPWVGLVIGAAGVLLGHLAMRKIATSASPLSGKGLSIAGLVTGYAAVAGGAFVILFLIWFGNAMSNAFSQ
jgi:hypothetical protein